ncbi:peptidoglycan-binding domain-containing protein [Methanobacterium oryzae]|uniref:peptidoglycan-binding domain-containing protein n=1 Tax=Methanobacterium oryzae TaxID=69540 RepID=UPI003D249233
MPFAGAAPSINLSNNELDINKINSSTLTNLSLSGLSEEEITKLKTWLKDKDINASTDDGNLTIGETGENVASLQKWLKENNFYTGETDGNFGTDTEAAVKAFQKEVGLKEDGKVGYYTLLAMQEWDEYAEAMMINTASTSSESGKDYSITSTSSKTYSSSKKTYTRTYTKSYKSTRYSGYTNGMDCWAMSSYLSGKLRSQGYTTRTIQYATSMSSRHRTVQYYSNGAWVNYDYKGNGYSSIYSVTSNYKNGYVVG